MYENPIVKTVLAIGGFDPSGGAGVLLDAAAISAAGAHGAAILTLNTVQDGGNFRSSRVSDNDEVDAALKQLLAGKNIAAVKTGALGNASIVALLVEASGRSSFPPMIIDPVIDSSSGGQLLDRAGVELMREALIPRATLVTPNLREAEILTGLPTSGVREMTRAAEQLIEGGAGSALVKGGHLEGETVIDVLVENTGKRHLFQRRRDSGGPFRGTGCALASLIAAFLAMEHALVEAVRNATDLLSRAMSCAYRIGPGPAMLGAPLRTTRSESHVPGDVQNYENARQHVNNRSKP